MAIVEEVKDNSQAELNWGLRNRVPLKHPSEVRRAKPLKPLVDLGLPADTQAELMERIQASFVEGSTSAAQTADAGAGGVVDADEVDVEEEEVYEDEDDYDGDELLEEEMQGPVVEEKDANEAFWDEFFDSLVVTVPFTFLYLLLDMYVHPFPAAPTPVRSRAHPSLVHLQYQHRPTLSLLASHAAKAGPTNRHASHPITTWFLTSASILSGARLIWIVNKAGWSLTTEQAPPMGALWILTIVQLPLSRAVLALVGVAAWTYYSGLKISP